MAMGVQKASFLHMYACTYVYNMHSYSTVYMSVCVFVHAGVLEME